MYGPVANGWFLYVAGSLALPGGIGPMAGNAPQYGMSGNGLDILIVMFIAADHDALVVARRLVGTLVGVTVEEVLVAVVRATGERRTVERPLDAVLRCPPA